MFLEVKGLVKSYDGKKVLNNVSFELEKGKILCLLGPSGCGKTTILNIIGGFVKADNGKVILEGADITRLPPEKREIATVFQSYGLFSHKNVYRNVEYGLKFKKMGKGEKAKKVRDVLEAVGLKGYEERRIHELSGGQQQRVALARSIVISPDLILLDEPFSNLDEKLKDSMRKELRRLVNYFDMTTILVTHDQEDTFTIADKVVLINEGKVVQDDTPINLYNNPASEFSMKFIGKSIILGDGTYLRPERIRICGHEEMPEDMRREGQLDRGRIIEVLFKGTLIEYRIRLEDGTEISVLELNRGKMKEIGESVMVGWE